MDAVTDLLSRHRLVTLTGSGGCGKTRLAVEVARTVESRFRDGVAMADLAPVESESLLASVVAASTGISEAGGASVKILLRAGLVGHELLLVLDNCEHIVEACAQLLSDLLPHCPDLTVLATSRTPIGLEGEVTWRVPSLSLPAAGAQDPVKEIHASETGRLLLDRVQLTRPDFEVTATDAPHVAAICRRLDGIPLAIELAASRIRSLGVKDLADGLEHRFNLLSSGMRTAPPRQRTLEASIDWSYDLLTDREQALLRRLSVFAGAFDVHTAEAVCADDIVGSDDIRTLLAGLIDHSLVQSERGPQGRYRLLESVRDYGRQRLADAGDEPRWRDRHFDQVRTMTAFFDGVTETTDLAQANEKIEWLIDEVRSALEWGLRSGRIGEAAAMAADLRLFWITQEHNQEGREWLTTVVNADVRTAGRETEIEIARAQLAASQLALIANDPFSQHPLASAALETVRRLGCRELEPMARVYLGWAQVFLQPDEAPRTFESAYELAEELGDDARRENAAFGRGLSAVFRGDLGVASEQLELGASIAVTTGSIGRHFVRAILGYARVLEGRIMDAVHLLDQVLAEEAGFDQAGFDLAHTVYGITLALRGDWDAGRERLEEVVERARVAGRNPALYAQVHLAMLERGVGRCEECGAHLDEIELLLAVPPGLSWFRTQTLTWRGDIAAMTGKPQVAQERWNEAMSVAEQSGNPMARSVASLGLARAASLASSFDRARGHARDAVRLAVEAAYLLGVIDGLEALAVLPGPDQAVLLAAVDAERARTGYARFPIDEPSYRAAVDSVGGLPEDPVPPLNEAIALATGDESGVIRPGSGPGSLTPAERRVAELVAEGLTNREVGEKLFISRRTVQAHLSHIYAKLDVSNRAEMATLVARHQESG